MSLIDKKGFYCPSDTVYFNEWTKLFIKSAKIHAPWAHIHVHIFDATDEDVAWCIKNEVSITTEVTPEQYCLNDDTKKGYWVTTRFIRLPEIYNDSTSVIAIDSDSLFKNDLSESTFDADLENSWVTVRGEDNASLGSALGFGKDNVRHLYREKLLEHKDSLRWFLDQEILDIMLKNKEINMMDLRYSDFTSQPSSFVWTGKGSRKFKKKFAALAEEYRKKD
jgi:hypothetical protein